jgi:hypothetical protein
MMICSLVIPNNSRLNYSRKPTPYKGNRFLLGDKGLKTSNQVLKYYSSTLIESIAAYEFSLNKYPSDLGAKKLSNSLNRKNVV